MNFSIQQKKFRKGKKWSDGYHAEAKNIGDQFLGLLHLFCSTLRKTSDHFGRLVVNFSTVSLSDTWFKYLLST